eukprot:m.107637 g.107637  ORF g.107637 m.107637 type:complete len:164 (+) comp15195_c0_seq2:1586-2077(+)
MTRRMYLQKWKARPPTLHQVPMVVVVKSLMRVRLVLFGYWETEDILWYLGQPERQSVALGEMLWLRLCDQSDRREQILLAPELLVIVWKSDNVKRHTSASLPFAESRREASQKNKDRKGYLMHQRDRLQNHKKIKKKKERRRMANLAAGSTVENARTKVTWMR